MSVNYPDASQPSTSQPGNTTLVTGGASLALGPFSQGKDTLSEAEGQSVDLGASNVDTPNGFITRGGANSLSVTPTYPQVTVV